MERWAGEAGVDEEERSGGGGADRDRRASVSIQRSIEGWRNLAARDIHWRQETRGDGTGRRQCLEWVSSRETSQKRIV